MYIARPTSPKGAQLTVRCKEFLLNRDFIHGNFAGSLYIVAYISLQNDGH
jgi:hypothetical protein